MKKTIDLRKLSEKYAVDEENGGLVYRVNSGRYDRYKAGTRAGSLMKSGTRTVSLESKNLLEHQVVWALHYGEWPKGDIHHINGDRTDNRPSNLARGHAGWHSHKADEPDLDRLRELLECDFVTGKLFWRKSPRYNLIAGAEAGNLSDRGYRIVTFDGRHERAHRIVWALFHGEWPRMELDHINGVRHDNRPENLRKVTRCQNNQNSRIRSDNKTGRTGVHLRKDNGKYMASIQANGKTINLGSYPSFGEAVRAREIAERKYHPFSNPKRKGAH